MHRTMFALLLAIIAPFTAQAQQTAEPGASAPASKARAQEVLKQTRAAIWDESRSKALQSLSITAYSRSVQGQRESTYEMAFDMLLPDKFLQTNVKFLGMGEFASILAVNGTQTWSDFKQPSAGFDFAAAKASMGSGGGKGGGKKAEIRGGAGNDSAGGRPVYFVPQANQPDLARMLLTWLLITPATLPVEFTYAGEAKAQADGKTADVLDVKGPNDFAARLFLDQSSHQILMLTYKAKARIQNFDRGQPPTQEEIERKKEAVANAPEVEIRWVVSDYRDVNGLTLPHRLTKSTAGQIAEEIELQKVKVNPSLKPDKFEKKK